MLMVVVVIIFGYELYYHMSVFIEIIIFLLLLNHLNEYDGITLSMGKA
jgi:hypothetical protein